MPNEDNKIEETEAIEEPIKIPEEEGEDLYVPPHTHYRTDLLDKRVMDVHPKDPEGTQGMLIYQTDEEFFRGYNGVDWKNLAWNADLSDYTLELAAPSDTLQLSSDAEVQIDNASYTEAKSITMVRAGKIKTKFDLKQAGGPNNTIAGKIYVNDVAVGDEHIHSLATYTTYEDTNIDVAVGDTVEVYLKSIDSNQAQVVRNFRIYYDLSTKDYIDAGDDAITVHWEYINSGLATGITSTDSISSVPATCNFAACIVYCDPGANNFGGIYQDIIIARTGKLSGKAEFDVGGTHSSLEITFDGANNQIDYTESGGLTWNLSAFYYT